MSLVARKLQAPLLVEGEIGDAVLAAYGADADDLTLEPARSRATESDVNEESLEAPFAQARFGPDGAQEPSTLEISQSKHHRPQVAHVRVPTKTACLSSLVSSLVSSTATGRRHADPPF